MTIGCLNLRVLFGGAAAIVVAAFFFLACTATTTASASAYQSLYSFCSLSACADGDDPQGSLLVDSRGTIFGVTKLGGTFKAGTIYALVNVSSRWVEQVIYNFCPDAGCPDGSFPTSGIIKDSTGNFYGTTIAGANAHGVVFEYTPSSSQYKVLYRFCSKKNCADGGAPSGLTYAGAAAGLPYDGASPLYGTTQNGGKNNSGVVFALAKNAKGVWKETVLHRFCDINGCTKDGFWPNGGLTMNSAGNLYGTTTSGGTFDQGVIYGLEPVQKKKKIKWVETVLYNFCSTNPCPENPQAGPTIDAAGNLLGTTKNGGQGVEPFGTLYKLTPGGQFSTLYSFCHNGDPCPDGAFPIDSVVLDASGNIFGTTEIGGNTDSGGVIFAINPTFHVLHTFCSVTGCKDGWDPEGGLSLDPSGNLFGTTTQGGDHNSGNVFEMTP
jgi:uncharacterized repeat protein (TIGR03803 family)